MSLTQCVGHTVVASIRNTAFRYSGCIRNQAFIGRFTVVHNVLNTCKRSLKYFFHLLSIYTENWPLKWCVTVVCVCVTFLATLWPFLPNLNQLWSANGLRFPVVDGILFCVVKSFSDTMWISVSWINEYVLYVICNCVMCSLFVGFCLF